MSTNEILTCIAELQEIKKGVSEIRDVVRMYNSHMAERLRRLNSIDATLTLLEQQVGDIRRRVKFLLEQLNKG